MKNKLTKEEEILQSKLEEASFEYSEANWNDLQNAMGKKGGLSSFSPVLKAVIGLVVLTGVVFVMNNAFDTAPSSTSNTAKTEATEKTATPVDVKENVLQDIEKEEKTLVHSENTSAYESSPSNNLELQPQDKAETQIPPSVIEKNEMVPMESPEKSREETSPILSSDDVIIHSIEILSPICLGTSINFEANISKKVQEDLYYQWFIDGKKIPEFALKATHLFAEPGEHTIALMISYEENVLAESSRKIYVEPAPQLDFVATDFTDPFYDQNVNVKVLNPQQVKYMWLDEDKVVKFGKETVFTFMNEGNHDITLEHTSENGCKTSFTKTVSMKRDFIEAFPNAFSPNGDGFNDLFELKVLQIPNTKFELQIFDISGNTVFKTQDAYEGWNGQLNNTGIAFEKGTFAWSAVIENTNGIKRHFRGKVIVNPTGIK